VIPAEAPQKIAVTTAIQGPLDFTGYGGDWSVGYVDPDTKSPVFVKTILNRVISASSATVTWNLDAEDLVAQLNGSTTSVNLQLAFQLQGTSPTVAVVSPSETLFELKPFNPRAAPLYQFDTDKKMSIQGGIGDTLEISSGITKDTYWFDGESTVGNICLFTGTEQPPYNFQCWKVQKEDAGLDTLTVATNSSDEFALNGPFGRFALKQADVPICYNANINVLVLASNFSACDVGFDSFVGQWEI